MDLDAKHRALVGSSPPLSLPPPSSRAKARRSRVTRKQNWIASSHSSLAMAMRRNSARSNALLVHETMEAAMGRGVLLWLLGVPIPMIILLWLFLGH